MTNLQRKIYDLIDAVMSFTDLNSKVMITTYKSASSDQQYLIDKMFLHLVGYSFEDLINQEVTK
jgi:hypothetical protein